MTHAYLRKFKTSNAWDVILRTDKTCLICYIQHATLSELMYAMKKHDKDIKISTDPAAFAMISVSVPDARYSEGLCTGIARSIRDLRSNRDNVTAGISVLTRHT